MNRRSFIESAFASFAVNSLPFRGMGMPHQLDRIGMQLYTVRALMKTDVPGTIAKVAAIGYKEVEFAGYFDYSPKDLRAILDKNGLTAPSCHISYDATQNKLPQAIDAAHVIGHKYIVCPMISEAQRSSPDGYKLAADLFNKAGETCHQAGVQFAYHNHFWEFLPEKNLGGKLPYDYFLQATDSANVKMELDLCWITVAGKDPLPYFKNNPNRFRMVHVKDLSKIPPLTPGKSSLALLDDAAANFTPIGGGIINWKVLLPAAQSAGVEHFFVENDEPKDAIANLTDSYKYLSTLRL
jgi:sugar phosphate isomerase/epimerase